MPVKTGTKTKSMSTHTTSNLRPVPSSKSIKGSPKVSCGYSSEGAAFGTSKTAGKIKGSRVN